MDNREFEMTERAGIEPATPADDVVEAVARIIDPAAWLVVDEHAPYVARHTIPFEKARVASLEKARAAISALQSRPAEPAGEEPVAQEYEALIAAGFDDYAARCALHTEDDGGFCHAYFYSDGQWRFQTGGNDLQLENGKVLRCVLTKLLYARPATPSNPQRLADRKRRRLPKLSEDLYEGYPAMSAQTHEAAVKEYAREAVSSAFSPTPAQKQAGPRDAALVGALRCIAASGSSAETYRRIARSALAAMGEGA